MLTQLSQLVTDKRRLITEYLLLACVVAIGGLAFSMYLSRMELRKELTETREGAEQQANRLMVVEEGYDLTKQALDTLKQLRTVDNRAVLDLQEKYSIIMSRSAEVENKLLLMGKSNDEIKQFYNIRLNRALVCVLEPTQCGQDSISDKN